MPKFAGRIYSSTEMNEYGKRVPVERMISMMDRTADTAYAKLIKKIEHQAKLLLVWNLQGGVSAQTTD
jgi:hypothetical protein